MNTRQLFTRFLVPSPFVTLYYYLKFGCLISTRAEVEISSFLIFGKKAAVGSFTKIKASDGPVRIGSRTSIANSCFIGGGSRGINIGDDCLIGPNVTIVGNNYSYDDLATPMRLQGTTSAGVTIGDNVWIGAGTVVLDGSSIGSGVIISPSSVVSGKIPDNAIVQGNPAKLIFMRR